MSFIPHQQPDAWQQNVIFTQLLQAPAARQALNSFEKHLKPIFTAHAFFSLDTGMPIVKLHTVTALLIEANLLPHLTDHDFKLGLHLAITPTLSQSASPSKDQPLHFDTFINAVAFCAFYYPPQTDAAQVPSPRLPDCSLPLDTALATACDRLVAANHSPRSVVVKIVSPASPALKFETPRTTFPESSPTQTINSAVSGSSGTEQWFTPAPSSIRTKLFPVDESNTPVQSSIETKLFPGEESKTPVTCQKDSHHDATLSTAISSSPHQDDCVSESETKSDVCNDNPEPTHGFDATPQLSKHQQDFPSPAPSCTSSERLLHPLTTEECLLENVEISSPPAALSQDSQEQSARLEVDIDPPLEESEYADGQNVSDGNSIPSIAVVLSHLDQSTLATITAHEAKEETQKTSEETDTDSPESAPTNLSLAPSSALSHVPSREGSFQSSELRGDPCTPCNASSIEPMSSRKLSFSDSDEASDSSSCLGNVSENEDTMTIIEHAFENCRAVVDCGEDDASSDLLSPYSQLLEAKELSSNEEKGTTTVHSTHIMGDMDYNLPSEGETDSEMDSAAQTRAQGFLESGFVSSERGALGSEVAIASEALFEVTENEQYSLAATHDIALTEPKITLGLPAEAFSEAGSAALKTPVAPAKSRLPDTDMEDMDEEEHTLLFENGYESEGSELSMRTRETMSKMVEDYLSIHGTASPQDGTSGKNCHVEGPDWTMTPDRKSHEAFGDGSVAESNVIIEDGPCISEKAVSKQSRITHVMEHSPQEFGKGSDRDQSGLKIQMDAEECDATADATSPLLYSQKGSFSSEITPDGLNLIKKQLVLPSPFVFTDSTVGSSMSSGPSVDEKDNVKPSQEIEKGEEQQTLVPVSVKKEDEVVEETLVCHQQDTASAARELEMMQVMRETLETCRVLREEIVKRQYTAHERPRQQQYLGGFGRWIEFGIFGLIVVFGTLVLVERRIQRGVFLDVLV